MKEKLQKLLENSYSPYSKFPVASIVVMKDGKEFVGVNVEDATTRAGTCAERSAIFAAISNGYKKHDFEKIYVMSNNDKIIMPCFVCRQMFVELFEKETKVIAMNPAGDTKEHTVAELCPYPFDESDLL